MTAVAANKVLVNAGLNIRIRGNKNYLTGDSKVFSQSVTAGEIVPIGTVVEVVFKNDDEEYTDKDYDGNWDSDLLH